MTEEINAMNVINSLTVGGGDQFIASNTKNAARCPFLLVYHLAETLIPDYEQQQKLSMDMDESKNNNNKDEEPMEQSIIEDLNEERNQDYFSQETAVLCNELLPGKMPDRDATFNDIYLS
uniref:Uncharacterized protein n=1 Tax=Meloidogyne javanica TaxID=6303 RepID=A0A915M8A5_MELJA